MNYLDTILKAVIIVYVTLFAVTNSTNIEIVLIPKYIKYDLPIFLPILIALFIGVTIAVLGFIPKMMRLSRELKSVRKNLVRAEEENDRLRTLPLLQDSNTPNEDN